MKDLLRWMLSVTILLLVLGFCFRGALCRDDAVTWAKRTITGQNKGVLEDIFRLPEISLPDLELPAPPEEITGAGHGTGSVTLPADTIGGCVGGPVERPARDVDVRLDLFRVRDRVVPKLYLDGVQVELDDWRYKEVPPSRWRATGSVSGDGDIGGGLAWAALNETVWAGPCAEVDLPDAGWASLGLRGGYHLTDNFAVDAGGAYRFGDGGGLHGTFGGSFRF
jgi:hypothetical protein